VVSPSIYDVLQSVSVCVDTHTHIGNFTSSLRRLARRPEYSISSCSLIARKYFGRLAMRPKELVEFAIHIPVHIDAYV